MRRRSLLIAVAAAAALAALAQSDPLPSWSDAPREALLGFVQKLTTPGGPEFMRAWAERIYGIPPEQVVGSSGATRFELRDGKSVLIKEPKVEFIDDGPGKPVGINRFIGRRPSSRSATRMATCRC